MNIENEKLNRAIRHYIGHGVTSFPDEDPARLFTEFGPELGSRLEAKVKSLLEELDRFKPDGAGPLLSAKRAVAELKREHPELDPNTIDALEWIYSWWWK